MVVVVAVADESTWDSSLVGTVVGDVMVDAIAGAEPAAANSPKSATVTKAIIRAILNDAVFFICRRPILDTNSIFALRNSTV
jgi:hypothetical protein